MNTITFEILGTDHDREVRIRIDGHDLIDRVRSVERPFAEAEGSPSIAGAYAGLAPTGILPPSKHFLGVPSPQYDYDGRTQILGCDCGVSSCWPLLCRIEVKTHEVRWSDFDQPHRSTGEGPKLWRYEKLGGFRFDRVQYEAALNAAAD